MCVSFVIAPRLNRTQDLITKHTCPIGSGPLQSGLCWGKSPLLKPWLQLSHRKYPGRSAIGINSAFSIPGAAAGRRSRTFGAGLALGPLGGGAPPPIGPSGGCVHLAKWGETLPAAPRSASWSATSFPWIPACPLTCRKATAIWRRTEVTSVATDSAKMVFVLGVASRVASW